MEKQTTYTIRVPEDLKKAFDLAAKAQDRNGAQLLRDCMRYWADHYMKTHAQGDLLKGKK